MSYPSFTFCWFLITRSMCPTSHRSTAWKWHKSTFESLFLHFLPPDLNLWFPEEEMAPVSATLEPSTFRLSLGLSRVEKNWTDRKTEFCIRNWMRSSNRCRSINRFNIFSILLFFERQQNLTRHEEREIYERPTSFWLLKWSYDKPFGWCISEIWEDHFDLEGLYEFPWDDRNDERHWPMSHKLKTINFNEIHFIFWFLNSRLLDNIS